jgi:hypothetical protein
MQFEFKVVDRYATGIAKTYETPAGFRWDWNDWVLCKVSLAKGNPIHWAIASSFRGNLSRYMCVTLMNPSYERMLDFQDVRKLAYFELVQVLEKVREDAGMCLSPEA